MLSIKHKNDSKDKQLTFLFIFALNIWSLVNEILSWNAFYCFLFVQLHKSCSFYRFCRKWKQKGRCFEAKYRNFMNTNCIKTCKVCNGGFIKVKFTPITKTMAITETITTKENFQNKWKFSQNRCKDIEP